MKFLFLSRCGRSMIIFFSWDFLRLTRCLCRLGQRAPCVVCRDHVWITLHIRLGWLTAMLTILAYQFETHMFSKFSLPFLQLAPQNRFHALEQRPNVVVFAQRVSLSVEGQDKTRTKATCYEATGASVRGT